MSGGPYLRYDELQRHLERLTEGSELATLTSLGSSWEGRAIPLVIVSRPGRAHHGRPALWIDGNLHATELAGSTACVSFLEYLLEHDGQDPEVTRALDRCTVYIAPRLNPDGAELALADKPRLIRSSTRDWPFPDQPMEGLLVEDIDGDGRILTMRIPDDHGPWKVSELDPRLMVLRDPTDAGGSYYRLVPEGRLSDDHDPALLQTAPDPAGLDLNRNYPSGWRTESEQVGAGPYPASEPEVRAAVHFIAAHPNICHGVTFHTFSGVLLRPYSHQADDEFPVRDLQVYQLIGQQGAAMTGYPAISVFHDFRYHPKDVITGAFDDWLYEHRGAFGWTVEIWSPQREAGIEEYAWIDWYRTHPIEDDLKMLAWNDNELDGRGFVDWRHFDHPQLGTVEIGGWDTMYCWRNPPPDRLADEVSRFHDWMVWQMLTTPTLDVDAELKLIEGDLYELRAQIDNTGYLPSHVSEKALQRKVVRGVRLQLTLPDDARIITGRQSEDVGQLAGWSHMKQSWFGTITGATDNRVVRKWALELPGPHRTVTLTAAHDRAGTVTVEVPAT